MVGKCFILLCMVPCSALDVTNIAISVDELAQTVSERFLSVAIDTGVIRHNWEKLNFSSPKVESLAKALSPCFVRVGGTEADFMTFSPKSAVITTNSRPGTFLSDIVQNKFVNFTMYGNQWDELNKFVERVSWDMIFDLNSLQRQDGEWSPKNAQQLMQYTSKKKYKIAGWELGNEPNSYKHHIGYSIDSNLRAQDYTQLRDLLKQYPQWDNTIIIGPSTTQVGKESARKYFEGFLEAGGPDIVTNPTFHHYYVDGREAMVDDFLDPDIMDSLPPQIKIATQIAKHPPYGKVWLGETGSAYGGGAPGLSDRYAAGFLWLDKLGVSAINGLDVLIRQSFYGGHYALIDHDMLDPNPDFWLSYMFKTLVGEVVLSVDIGNTTRSLRFYAHCTNTKRSNYSVGSITLYGMNLDDSPKTVVLKQFGPNVKLHVYMLQPADGNLKSQLVALNGKTLHLNSDYSLPNILTPSISYGIFTIPPQSFGFVVLPNVNWTFCL